MVRIRHLLSLVIHFPYSFSAVQSYLPSLETNQPVVIHETSHRKGSSQFHRNLHLVRGLVETRDETVDVSVEYLYSILNEIKLLEDKVLALLPSGSGYIAIPSSTTQVSGAASSPSNGLSGGAFIESAGTESPTSSVDIEIVDDDQDVPDYDNTTDLKHISTMQVSLAEQTQDLVVGDSVVLESIEHPTAGQTQGSWNDMVYSSSVPGSSVAETQSLDAASLSSVRSVQHAASEQAQNPGVGGSVLQSSTQGLSTQETGFSGSDRGDGPSGNEAEDGVSENTSLRQEFNDATGAAQTRSPRQSSSTLVTVVGDYRTSYAADGRTMYFDTPEPYPRTTSSSANEDGSTTGEPTDSLESQDNQELTTIVFTSTNTRSSARTMTTTLTKFLPLPQTRDSAIFIESLGVANATVTTRLSSVAKATAETPVVDSETHSFVPPVMSVPRHNATADGPLRSGFRTLSKPTTSVGEEEA